MPGASPDQRPPATLPDRPTDGPPARPAGARLARTTARAARLTARAALRAATARPVLSSGVGGPLWRMTVAAPGLPDSVRARAARKVARRMTRVGRTVDGASLLRTAAARAREPELRIRLLGEAQITELVANPAPLYPGRVVDALLAMADRALRVGQSAAAAEALSQATAVAFHRTLHIDQLTSPLAADPEGYLAPLRRSSAAAAAAVPRGRARPAAAPPKDRPLRLLIATSTNDTFLRRIREHCAAHPGMEVRFLDLATEPTLRRMSWAATPMLGHRLAGRSTFGEGLEHALRPYLDWADTVLVDWCVGPAAMFTMVDPGTTRIVVRLHSYEAMTRWPHIVDFSRVDDLVFVASHVRDLVTTLVPALAGGEAPDGPAGTRLHIVDNAMDLRGFARDKADDARFTLGLVGIGQVVKDPRWAIEVLRRLRDWDPRYRLLLIGGDMNPDTSAAARIYAAELDRDLAELEPSGAVRRFGRTNDVPAALTEVGVILSTSVREGCHCGLMEGAASGAVPVVRDWPFFAGRPNSARTLYPRGWVVGNPGEAAERVLAVTATPEGWRAAGRDAQRYALETWDWSVVQHHFDRLILG
jgi:glycosyltransferase involved in cell wall biosynthesis